MIRWIKNKIWWWRYRKYLRSDKWKRKRNERLVIDKCRCQECGIQSNLQIHHLTYKNVFNENMEDLTTLCIDCHQKKHKNKRLKNWKNQKN